MGIFSSSWIDDSGIQGEVDRRGFGRKRQGRFWRAFLLKGNENLTVLPLSISRVARVGRPSSNAQISALDSGRYISSYIA